MKVKPDWTGAELEILCTQAAFGDPLVVKGRTRGACKLKLYRIVRGGQIHQHFRVSLSKGKGWSGTTRDILRRLHLRGARVADLAAALGRSQEAIRQRIHLEKSKIRRVPGRRWMPAEYRRLTAMLAEGKTVREAAAALGRTQKSAEQKLARERSKRNGKSR
jgi:hypothetical protein